MATPFDLLPGIFTDHLGEEVTVTPEGGSSRTIRAMIVNRVTDDLDIVQNRPAIHARSSDVADLGDGDAVVMRAQSYVVREIRPDGRGMTTVTLGGA